jgi:hypothetical protein
VLESKICVPTKVAYMSSKTTPTSTSGETSSASQVLPKGPVVRVLLVRCCSVEPWVCPCANNNNPRRQVNSREYLLLSYYHPEVEVNPVRSL